MELRLLSQCEALYTPWSHALTLSCQLLTLITGSWHLQGLPCKCCFRGWYTEFPVPYLSINLRKVYFNLMSVRYSIEPIYFLQLTF